MGENTATVIVSTVGNGDDFACGGQFCAWLGLVPKQDSISRWARTLAERLLAGHCRQKRTHVLGGAAPW
jgi:transposase